MRPSNSRTYALVDGVPDAVGGVVESAADGLDRYGHKVELVEIAYISMAKALVKTKLRKM